MNVVILQPSYIPWRGAPALGRGTYLHRGRCVRGSLAGALQMPCEPITGAAGAGAWDALERELPS